MYACEGFLMIVATYCEVELEPFWKEVAMQDVCKWMDYPWPSTIGGQELW